MHIDLFKLKTFPELHQSGFFPNMKEFEESYACHVVFRKLKYIYNKVLVIGDGVYPRTGLMMTMMNKVQAVHSVDPKVRLAESIAKLDCLKINRLDVFEMPFRDYINRENYRYMELCKTDNLCLILAHSHVAKEELIQGIDVLRSKVGLLSIINMPCCEKNVYPDTGDFINFEIKTPLSTVFYSEDI